MVRTSEGEHNSVLHLAAAPGGADVLVALLCYARTLNTNSGLVRARNADNETALHVAVRVGSKDAAAILLAESCPCNVQRFSDRNTALHLAVLGAYGDIVKLLLDNGASPRKNCTGCTAFRCAVRNGQQEIVSMFLAHYDREHGVERKGPKRHLTDYLEEKDVLGRTLLHDAVLTGCRATVRLLLRAGSSVDTKDYLGRSPSHGVATTRGDSKVAIMVNLLFRNAAAVQIADGAGRTPLHLAVASGDIDLVVAILMYEPSVVDFEDSNGTNALGLAIEEGSDSMCSMIIKLGAAWQQNLFNAITTGEVWFLAVLLKALAKPLECISCIPGQSLLYTAVIARSAGEWEHFLLYIREDAYINGARSFLQGQQIRL